ncbi:MAG: RidA family protein [Verrucomicrobiae bacterium]|nr:RidA family protein [Verrucomicrobiae bacterium]
MSNTTPDQKAKALGLVLDPRPERPFLNLCARVGKLLYTSGHTSEIRGKVGQDLTVEQGYTAARQAMSAVLRSIYLEAGSFNKVRIVKLLGCVNATPDFKDCSKVINGASDLVHEIFGKEANGYHARSALGFATLPAGVAVEVEAICELL